MKIAGREISGPNKVTLVLPREDSEDIVIIAQACDTDAVDDILIEPQPPIKVIKGEKIKDLKDEGYIDQMNNYYVRRLAYIILKSLEPSDIEWETVDIEDPKTWTNYNQELKDAGFSTVEINRIGAAVMEANALDEAKLEAARQVFLRGQAEEKSTSGPST